MVNTARTTSDLVSHRLCPDTYPYPYPSPSLPLPSHLGAPSFLPRPYCSYSTLCSLLLLLVAALPRIRTAICHVVLLPRTHERVPARTVIFITYYIKDIVLLLYRPSSRSRHAAPFRRHSHRRVSPYSTWYCTVHTYHYNIVKIQPRPAQTFSLSRYYRKPLYVVLYGGIISLKPHASFLVAVRCIGYSTVRSNRIPFRRSRPPVRVRGRSYLTGTI